MQRSKTHFEQIPVETVKKIAKPLSEENNEIESASVSAESQGHATAPPEGWREVAQKVQQEQDPIKMAELVQQLIARFDEEQLGKRLPPTKDSRSGSGSSRS